MNKARQAHFARYQRQVSFAPLGLNADAGENKVHAAIQACEAIKILAGKFDAVSAALLKLDLWNNQAQRIDAARPRADCDCCQKKQFEFLEGL